MLMETEEIMLTFFDSCVVNYTIDNKIIWRFSTHYPKMECC